MTRGALDEARANLDAGFRLTWPSAKAIGAPELIGYLKGDRCLKAAVADGKIATRQFAKRQRTWFRSKMSQWTTVVLP